MFRSVRPYLDEAGLEDPVVCYQGPPWSTRARVSSCSTSRSTSGSREAIAALQSLGLSPNVYVDDQLYVAVESEYSRAYSVFQRLPVTEVGDLLSWLERPPTKLVAVAEPPVLAEIRPGLERQFDGRVFITTSLPYMLELGNPAVTKGSGMTFVASALGLRLERMVAFGDGENDVELLGVAGARIAIEGRIRAFWRSPTGPVPGPSTRASRP